MPGEVMPGERGAGYSAPSAWRVRHSLQDVELARELARARRANRFEVVALLEHEIARRARRREQAAAHAQQGRLD